jgi:hypothetical protein
MATAKKPKPSAAAPFAPSPATPQYRPMATPAPTPSTPVVTQGAGGAKGSAGGRPKKPSATGGKTVFEFNPRPPGSPPIKFAPDGPPTLGPDSYWYSGQPPKPPGPTGPTYDGEDGGSGDNGGGDGGGGYDPWAAYQAMLQEQQTNNVIAVVTALFKQYGLESLTPKIIEYARAGYGGDAIGVMLRDTPEYKARFPAMATLMAKKRAISEAEYISYEQQAAQLEKRYGLPSGLVQGSVTSLLENEVSASELQDRVVLASDAALQSPQELRDVFRNYYGIDTGGLAGYFLDPTKATPILQKQFVASQIGAEAVRQSVGLQVDVAENLQQLGVTQDVARQGFANVSRQMAFTAGRGDVVNQEQLIGGNLLQREADIREIERAAAARTGRFQGGGGYSQDNAGIAALRGSST